jgi:hypothetical protein
VTAHIPMSSQEIILDFLYSVDPAELERRVRRAPPEAGTEAAVVIRALADLVTEAGD